MAEGMKLYYVRAEVSMYVVAKDVESAREVAQGNIKEEVRNLYEFPLDIIETKKSYRPDLGEWGGSIPYLDKSTVPKDMEEAIVNDWIRVIDAQEAK